MPTIRIGFSSDFILKNNTVGLGTTTSAHGKLDVDGTIKGNFNITGVATLTSYGGFVAQKQNINKASTIGFGTVGLNTAAAAIGVGATHVANQYYETETGFTDLGGVHHGDDQYYNTLSEDLVIDDGQILNITSIDMVGVTTIGEYDSHSHQSHVCLGALEEVSVTDHFSVPCGGSNDRQSFIEGTVRFNDDLNTIEFFNGNEWRQFTYNQGQSGRAIISSGYDSGTNYLARYDYITISTLGNSAYFGDMQSTLREKMGCGSAIRALFGGGAVAGQPYGSNEIDYLTIASAGNGIDFGNLTAINYHNSALSSSTRGVWGGGYAGNPAAHTNVIEYVEISTIGNALDFGDLSGDMDAGSGYVASCASPTRGVFSGGTHPTSPAGDNVIRSSESITIASKGNSIDFGNMTFNGGYCGGISNTTRGIIGGSRTPAAVNNIDFITIASTGNAVHFGDLTVARAGSQTGSTQTRGVFIGGSPTADTRKTIDYITISSSGNAIDFGESGVEIDVGASVSDSHGGLGGF